MISVCLSDRAARHRRFVSLSSRRLYFCPTYGINASQPETVEGEERLVVHQKRFFRLHLSYYDYEFRAEKLDGDQCLPTKKCRHARGVISCLCRSLKAVNRPLITLITCSYVSTCVRDGPRFKRVRGDQQATSFV
jgi:hypothetical protein